MGRVSFTNLERQLRLQSEEAKGEAPQEPVAPPQPPPRRVQAQPQARTKLAPEAAQQGVRARQVDGTFKADNPSTPDVDEAWKVKPAPRKTEKS